MYNNYLVIFSSKRQKYVDKNSINFSILRSYGYNETMYFSK